jgi:hypothetical protein
VELVSYVGVSVIIEFELGIYVYLINCETF